MEIQLRMGINLLAPELVVRTCAVSEAKKEGGGGGGGGGGW